MTQYLTNLFSQIGLTGTMLLLSAKGVITLLILLCSFGAYFLIKLIIVRLLAKMIALTKTKWDDMLVEQGFLKGLAPMGGAMIFYLMLPLLLKEYPPALQLIRRLVLAGMTGIIVFLLDKFIESINTIYNTYPVSKARPIKGYIQLIKIFLYIIGIILGLTTILQINPLGILSGIGAMTAVLLLVFRDSILGFVSGIQLTANAMIRIGDWIEMPKYGADGDVIDITLQTVKIRNWDQTISSIPIYALISDSFKNWRGMSESGGRRIKRSLNIDMTSVGFLTGEEIEEFKKISYLNEYIKNKKKEVDLWNEIEKTDTASPVNGRRLTNLGTFRAYIFHYLKNHPKIHNEMTFLIRYLSPTEHGIPLEIYVFSNDQVWENYEALQADIFDHLLASLSYFNLRIFQNPSAYDMRQIGAPK